VSSRDFLFSHSNCRLPGPLLWSVTYFMDGPDWKGLTRLC